MGCEKYTRYLVWCVRGSSNATNAELYDSCSSTIHTSDFFHAVSCGLLSALFYMGFGVKGSF